MDGIRSTSRIAEVLRPFAADIICLQELYQHVPPTLLEDQPAALGRQLHRTAHFQRCLDFGIGGYGIGILARNSSEARRHRLPGGREPRGLLQLTIAGANGRHILTAFCTHWGLTADERMLQAEATAAIVNAARRPVALCGDLNEQPHEPAIALLLARTELRDVCQTSNLPTFPSASPSLRIDYILCTPELRPERVETYGSGASDHLALSADLHPLWFS